jgi:hypothetical protein
MYGKDDALLLVGVPLLPPAKEGSQLQLGGWRA